jgi:hypothetical protein
MVHLRPAVAAAIACALISTASGLAGEEPGGTPAGPAGEPAQQQEKPLPFLDIHQGEGYRTPLAGEGFRTRVLGRDVTVEPRDRTSVSAWDLGLATEAPGVAGSEILPFGAIYLWRRPDPDTFFRATLVGLYDEVWFSKGAERTRPFELVLTFDNYTVPFAQTEAVDGHRLKEEELIWGNLWAGAGAGLRTPLEFPGADRNANMAALSLTAEPGYLFFDDGKDTAADFVVPQDSFEMRAHLRGRYDHVVRNLMELAHRGFTLGTDLVYGARSNWEDWGPRRGERASRADDWLAFSAYGLAAGGVPFVDSDRHRLIGTLHGGIGDGLDRFSAFRIGGGPSGHEYEAVSRPLIPGAIIEEFSSRGYVVAVGEYRWEPVFFVYLGIRSSIAYLDRRRIEADELRRTDDVLSSIGARVTTGFAFETQLEVSYDYNFGVIRHDEYGGHAVTVHLSRQF